MRVIVHYYLHSVFSCEKKIMALKLCIFFAILGISYGINNGLGRTPQMGELQIQMISDTRYDMIFSEKLSAKSA